MKRLVLTLALLICLLPLRGQSDSPCSNYTTAGNDFWVSFIPNGNVPQTSFSIIATGLDNATITVSNPVTGWNTSVEHTGGTKTYIQLPNATSIPSATAHNMGYHVTSTQDISLYASNYRVDSWDYCNILPSERLTSQYIVQDYPNNSDYAGGLALVATEDNTVFSMTLPCTVENLSLSPGSTYTVTLNTGQSLALKCGINEGFSGMTISSNNKPFALFQGHTCARVGTTDVQRGRDHLVEQAIPLDWWGTEFVVVSQQARTEGDQIRITASSNSTTVQISCSSGSPSSFTLNAGETYEWHLPANSAAHITSSGPVYVCKYLISFDKFNATSLGDPASVDIPPVHNWLCSTTFPVHNCNNDTWSEQYIDPSHNYLDIVTTTAAASSMILDGNPIAASLFTPLTGTPYCYYQHNIAPGAHTLENTVGPFYATVSGLSRWVGYAFLAGMALEAEEPTVPCQRANGSGSDFWMAVPLNGGEQTPNTTSLIITGDTTCTVTASAPLMAWSQTVNHSAGSATTITLPNWVQPEHYNMGENKGIHVTSTASIQLVALQTELASSGTTNILPTEILRRRYIVNDYPADPSRTSNTGATITIIATEPNTTVRYTPPCTLYSIPGDAPAAPAGSQASLTLGSAGQTLTLMANSPNASLAGMVVTSNNPIAIFQGNQFTGLPHETPSGDFIFDQALPVEYWGKTFPVMADVQRSVGNILRVVAGDTACTLTMDNGNSFSLTPRQTMELDISANANHILSSSAPVSVGLCSKSSDWNAEPGDAALLSLPAFENGICHSSFATPTTERIVSTWNLYIATDSPSAIYLDGNDISSRFQPIGTTSYSHACIAVQQGSHTLNSNSGNFVAWLNGIGNVDGYSFSLGEHLVPLPYVPETHHDTIHLRDTVCQGEEYRLPASFTVDGQAYTPPLEGLIYIRASETAQPGTLQRWSNWVEDDTLVHHIHLTLTILASAHDTLAMSLIAGDTLLFADTAITLAGTYTFRYTAQNGCDSVVTLIVGYETAGLTASANGVCPGDEVTLTATGTHTFIWSASPADPSLDTLQGQNPVSVHPSQTTTYSLLDAAGNTIVSITVGVEPPPALCIESNRTFIDFDHPVLSLHDCSVGRHHTSWSFSDGATLHGERARRLFHHPLPDSVSVTMTSCNNVGCCADTTVAFATKIRSVWFPNIFFPDQADNNRFGCYTSFEVQDFEMTVYNRQGLLVWQSDDINAPWDGTHDGTPVPQGAYVYRWYLTDIYGDRRNGIGTVTLIR